MRETYPRSYPQALAILSGGGKIGFKGRSNCELCSIRQDAIGLFYDGVPLVTFFADGRIKITTRGRNDFTSIEIINGSLPHRYRVRKKSGGQHLFLKDTQENRRLATFLGSTIFTPGDSPVERATDDSGDVEAIHAIINSPIMAAVSGDVPQLPYFKK